MKNILLNIIARIYFNLKVESIPMVVYNDLIGKKVIFDGFYDIEFLKAIVDKFDFDTQKTSFCDIGANIGNHSMYLSKFFHEVCCFEPQIRTFRILELNTERIKNIKIFNYGIGSEEKKLVFEIPLNNNGSASQEIKKEESYKEEVLIKPFDRSLENISYIKIDVEGNEFDVLIGLENLLALNRPILSIEINRSLQKRELILNKLLDLGYSLFNVMENKSVSSQSSVYFAKTIKTFYKLILHRKNNLIPISKKDILNSKFNYSQIVFVHPDSIYRLKT